MITMVIVVTMTTVVMDEDKGMLVANETDAECARRKTQETV